MKTSSWLSKSIKITAVLALATAAIGFANSAKALEIDYASAPGGLIVFPGDSTFHFTAGNNTTITTGSCAGCAAAISGVFTISNIQIIVPGLAETGDVSGTGAFVIHDGMGNDLTATLIWTAIAQVGAGNALNFHGSVNLTDITYSGTNADLVTLAAAHSAIDVLSFQFTTQIDLTFLAVHPGGDITNSFSGTIATVPDGGTTVALLGVALLGIGGVRRMFRARKS